MKLTQITLALAMAFVFGTAAMADEACCGWKPLFNADLSNATFKEGVWTIGNDGVMTASEDQSIWAKGDYENFEVALEFMTDHHTNSGVLVYCTDLDNWIPNSVEVQILDDSEKIKEGGKPERSDCAAIYGHVAPSKLLVKNPGEWNTMVVKCVGPKIEVTLNGEKVTEMDMTQWTSAKTNPDGSEIPGWLSKPKAEMATKGAIGFQGKHGQSNIYFKNIKIRDAK